MSNNNVKDWGEFQKLAELPSLEDLLFVGEPMQVLYKPLFSSPLTLSYRQSTRRETLY